MDLQQILNIFSEGLSIVKTTRNIKRTTSILKMFYLVIGAVIIILNLISMLRTINRPKLA